MQRDYTEPSVIMVENEGNLLTYLSEKGCEHGGVPKHVELLGENRPALTCPVARRCGGSQLCCSAGLPACALLSGKAILATGNFASLSPTKGSDGDEEVGL